MRYWCRVLCVAAVVLGMASSALARVAVIETTARLSDHSDVAFRAAIKEAVETAVRGAVAMGLSHVALRDVSQLDEDTVAVQILVSDAEAAEEESGAASPETGPIPSNRQSL